ncbi:MAG TPA: maltose acetyltransferase domain-containing protein [Actinomycetales bacterium]|nr:maltose acetyltransferase domain-containing protein [Actinomycetales bacterium]
MAEERSMLDRLLAGEEYIAEGADLFEMSHAGLDFMQAYNATSARQTDLRRQILEKWLGGIGAGSAIRPPFTQRRRGG